VNLKLANLMYGLTMDNRDQRNGYWVKGQHHVLRFKGTQHNPGPLVQVHELKHGERSNYYLSDKNDTLRQ
jgi:hypothetical protein